jgi:RNA polymerase sigma factor (TIGR02999 family)
MSDDLSQLLAAQDAADPQAAEKILPLVYEELRKLAAARLAQERPGQTLQPTALVHEAYMRLIGGTNSPAWQNRGHFFAAAAEAMRRILIDAARRKQSSKRGGGRRREEMLDAEAPLPEDQDDLLALDEALTKLAAQDPVAAQLVKLRYFGGLTMEQAAEVLDMSPRNAYYNWNYARSWLFRQLQGE